MFTLHAVQARFGDCLLLEYGTAARPRYLLIDGGPPDNFANVLDAALKDLVKTKKLDMLVVSHVDNDHIVGVLDLFAALEGDAANKRNPRVKVPGLWHNSFQKSIDRDGQITLRMMSLMAMAAATSATMPLLADAFLGIGEGHRLRVLAKQLKVPVNKGFKKDLIQVETAGKPIKFGSLTLRVVGPTEANLKELQEDWLKWLEKAERDTSRGAAILSNSDKSVPNLSSIVLLAEANGKTALLTGDARGDHITQGLQQAKLLKNGKFHVDLLKVQHHGSNRNITLKFLKAVTADTYVISADGTHDNPDYDTLKWIVEAAESQNRAIKVVVTNATQATKKIQLTHKPAKFSYTLTVRPKSDHSVAVPLA
jgi:hypothetical protein